MSEKNTGGPAFPCQELDAQGAPRTELWVGMTLRDKFAEAALPQCIGAIIPIGSPGWQEDAAWLAWSVADAFLKAREA